MLDNNRTHEINGVYKSFQELALNIMKYEYDRGMSDTQMHPMLGWMGISCVFSVLTV